MHLYGVFTTRSPVEGKVLEPPNSANAPVRENVVALYISVGVLMSISRRTVDWLCPKVTWYIVALTRLPFWCLPDPVMSDYGYR